MRIVILNNSDDVAAYGAQLIIRQIQTKPDSVLGLATGSSPMKLYDKLVEAVAAGDVSLSQCVSFNLDEYVGLAPDHDQSYRSFMQKHLFERVDIRIENTHVPDGLALDPEDMCAQYEQAIRDHHGIDFQLLGIGANGHIGFNEPSSSLRSRTRIKTLTMQTVEDNARFFRADEFQPELAITMGIETIMESRQIMLLATGEHKAAAVKAMIEGPVSASCPASILQFHPKATIVLDTAAAGQLENTQFYQRVEQEAQKFEAK
ncbi:glucosamine-6-phosphate deaminase [Gynuella sunshinyii]|uniref:Glucosamine-6-phosphate deaminase n=1 Tax=Gynuella sunshinyii YC6258 TaxID=1445510 RepID=A0A0C5VQM3_9GAMM|nr:glucosamine-6-phosphate deaminase [Gynuella sunshinyii]AJQ92569.1 6-phosphogluconolactonase/Glucosamine-6-phosphate isomerase/deaminase [Gynuella sunshinyii YC6258]